MPASIYVHIPFCLKRCIYCDFVSGIYEVGNAAAYIKALKREILTVPRGTSFSTLFIGGGTPTVLPADVLRDLIAHIFDHLSFPDNYEATIEANPGTLDHEKLTAIRESGINRLSIGVQSFNDDELMLLGRMHTRSIAEKAVHLAEDAGFKNIGIDLIYGIPQQSMASWKETLEMATTLRPQHIASYELTVENGTTLSAAYREGILQSPDDELTGEMYSHAIDHLVSEGYRHYEISNFAIPGYPCRHNLNYWDRGEYYGVGVAAHSFVKDHRFFNSGDLQDYLRTVSYKGSPVRGREDIKGDKAISEALFLGLRKTEGIKVESFLKRYGLNILTKFQDELADMQEQGLIEIENSECSNETGLRLTRRGLLLSNEVFVKFI